MCGDFAMLVCDLSRFVCVVWYCEDVCVGLLMSWCDSMCVYVCVHILMSFCTCVTVCCRQ